MFKNIGNKIKKLATLFTTIGIIFYVLIGLVFGLMNSLITESYTPFVIGIIVAIIGSLISWLSSFILYGFGEIIFQLQQLNTNQKILQNLLYNINQNTKPNDVQNTNTTVQ